MTHFDKDQPQDSTPISSWLNPNTQEQVSIYLHNGHYHVMYQTMFETEHLEEAEFVANTARMIGAPQFGQDYVNDWVDVSEQMPDSVTLFPVGNDNG